MNTWIRRNFDTLGVGSAVIVIAGLAFGAAGNTCPVAKPLNAHSDKNIHNTGGETMFTTTKQEGKVHHADEANFDELVLNSDVPVLVDFYADWCGPCRRIAPVLEELAKEATDAEIVKVNVDQDPELAARYGISSIPSLKVFEGGEVVDEYTGVASKAHLEKMLGI
jgi:thioredoxin 1